MTAARPTFPWQQFALALAVISSMLTGMASQAETKPKFDKTVAVESYCL